MTAPQPTSDERPGPGAGARAYLGRPAVALLLIGAFLALGTALVVGPSSESREARALAERGETTAATVKDSRTVVHSTGGGRSRSVEEDVTFDTRDGDTVHVMLKDCDRRTPDPVGSQIDVIYDPDQPTGHTATRFAHPVCATYVKSSLPFTIAGAIAILAAFTWWGFRWGRIGWTWWGLGVTLLLFGALVTASAFTDNCHCRPMAWLGAPMALLGLASLAGRATRGRHSPRARGSSA